MLIYAWFTIAEEQTAEQRAVPVTKALDWHKVLQLPLTHIPTLSFLSVKLSRI